MRSNAVKTILGVAVILATTLACAALSGSGSNNPSGSSGGGNSSSSSEGPSLLKDNFSDSGSGWGTGTDSSSSIEYASNALVMKIFKSNYFTWSNPNQDSYQNVHMEVTANNPTAATRVGFGLMCDQQVTDSAYYYFAVTSDGQYVIGKAAVAKEDVFLTNNNDWATSNLIPKNAASYRLGADCGNGTLTLYVNGQKVDSAADATYTKGNVGLFLWSGDDPSGQVTYDDFAMTSLK